MCCPAGVSSVSYKDSAVQNRRWLLLVLQARGEVDGAGNLHEPAARGVIREAVASGGGDSRAGRCVCSPTRHPGSFRCRQHHADQYVWGGGAVTRNRTLAVGRKQVIYNAKETISGLKAPVLTDPKGVWPSESTVIWGLLSQAIVNKDWGRAREVKKEVEEKQRELTRQTESRGETWAPKHFTVNYNKEVGWECSPIQKRVPPAPISVTIS